MKRQLPRILGAGIVAVVVLVYATTFVVHEGEGALIETFGDVEPVLETGLHVVWPWPIQKVRRYDLRDRLYEGPLMEVSTADNQLLVAGAFCLWRITDPARFRNAVGDDQDRAEDLIAGPLANGINETFASHRFSDMVQARLAAGDPSAGPATLGRIEQDIRGALEEDLAPYGMKVEEVGLHQLVLPARATEGVFAQMREAKERDAARLESMGKARAEEIRAEAERAYQEGLREARTQAGATVAAARAEEAKMLAGAGEADLLMKLDRIETMKELLANGETTIVLDQRTPPLDILDEVESERPDSPAGENHGALK